MTTLNGYMRSHLKEAGGLSKVELVSAGDVVSVNYDAASGLCTGLILAGGCSLAEYATMEDRSSYTETLRKMGPSLLVEHELTMVIPGAVEKLRAATGELAAKSAEGFLAVVRDNSGETFLVGWSPRFGKAFPLRMSDADIDTESKWSEDPCARIKLRCRDTTPACRYTL